MCMIKNGDKILVLDRNDPVWPGLTFPGGHVEPHESFNDSVVREIKEETGLTISHPQFVGVKQFYDKNHERYLVFFYVADEFKGTVKASDEGTLTWMTKEELQQHKLAYNFDHDLPVFFNPNVSEHMLDGKRDELFQMKKTESKVSLFIALIAIIIFASVPLWHIDLNANRPHTQVVKKKKPKKKKKVVHKVTWGYPFKRLYEKKIKFKSGQKFGETDVIRRYYPTKSYFHDGYDFGFSEVGHSTVYAVHAGTIHKVKYAPGLGLYVWVISDDGYVEIYQEGFLSITDIYVKKGQKIKLGQKIGRLTGSHIHLGITKTDKKYIDKHGVPCRYYWKDNGTWLNPMKIIEDDIAKEKVSKQ